MRLNSRLTNRIVLWLILVVLLSGAVSCFFLNEAQRIFVGIGVVLCLINLLGLRYFLNKNLPNER